MNATSSARACLVAFSCVLLSGSVLARDLSFEDRVRAQEALERVSYSHQIGATRPFETAVPREVLEKKVLLYLRESAALQTFWNAPVTAEMLRAETDRMAAATRLPERLAEMYAALGDDPFLIQECIARPVVADRLARDAFAGDAAAFETWWSGVERNLDERSVHAVADSGDVAPPVGLRDASVLDRSEPPAEEMPEAACAGGASWGNSSMGHVPQARSGATAVWTGSSMILWGGTISGNVFNTGERYDPATDSWRPMALLGSPNPRFSHTAVWTGTRMVVWGGQPGGGTAIAEGGRYDPLTDAWSPISLTNAPQARYAHTAVWTGKQMVVWGGTNSSGSVLFSNGGRYDPARDRWSTLSTAGAPAARSSHTAVWSGKDMVVWGGKDGAVELGSGGRYNPKTDTWQPVSTLGAPQARTSHTAIWSGSKMVVWGGFTAVTPNYLGTGGRYDPRTDTWSATSTIGAASARTLHSAVWTGQEMIVWGGFDGTTFYQNSGGRYNPASDTWTATSLVGAPSARTGHDAVWTGTRMVIWGGTNGTYFTTGGRYDPVSDTWTSTFAPTTTPLARHAPTSVWTGSLFLVWGGAGFVPINGSSGARYDPATDSWTPMSLTGAPSGRNGATSVWTGSRMIVWGGSNLNTGARYDPVADVWSTTSTVNAPEGRTNHTAIWTGSQMIVWGGKNAFALSTGGRYDPSTDTWTATSLVNVPDQRSLHAAVWTGSRMIVWGGMGFSTNLSSGGLYDPSADAWTQTATPGAPIPRNSSTALWTGTRMLIWGGMGGATLNSGSRYDPATDTWSAMSTTGAPAARMSNTAVWTGSRMIVWGGTTTPGFDELRNGGEYDPASNVWCSITETNSPPPRDLHASVWTGTSVLVWGGRGSSTADLDSGGIYTPAP